MLSSVDSFPLSQEMDSSKRLKSGSEFSLNPLPLLSSSCLSSYTVEKTIPAAARVTSETTTATAPPVSSVVTISLSDLQRVVNTAYAMGSENKEKEKEKIEKEKKGGRPQKLKPVLAGSKVRQEHF
jgi:hypothetical protein